MKQRLGILIVSVFILITTAACGASTTTIEAAPTNTPIPGFTKITGKGVEMWFPESWQGGDLEKDMDVLISKINELGSDYEQIAKMIEANPGAFALWVFDTDFGELGYLTNANIVKESVVSVITIDKYIEAVKKQLPASMVISDQKNVTLNQYEAARLELSMDVGGVITKELMYVVKHESTIYTITFATSEQEFATRTPVFEQIASTFYIQP